MITFSFNDTYEYINYDGGISKFKHLDIYDADSFNNINEIIVFDNYNGDKDIIKNSRIKVNLLLYRQQKYFPERFWVTGFNQRNIKLDYQANDYIIPKEWLKKDISEKPERFDFNFFTGNKIGCKHPDHTNPRNSEVLHDCEDRGTKAPDQQHNRFINQLNKDNKRIESHLTQKDLDEFVNNLMLNKNTLKDDFLEKNKYKLLELYNSVSNPSSKEKIKEYLESVPINKVNILKNLATDKKNLHYNEESGNTDPNTNGFLIPGEVKIDVYCRDHNVNLVCKPGEQLNLNYNTTDNCYRNVCVETFRPSKKNKKKGSKVLIYVLSVLGIFIFMVICYFIYTRYYINQ